MSSPNITRPGALLCAPAIQLMGSGLGSVPMDQLLIAIRGLLAATVPGVGRRHAASAVVGRGKHLVQRRQLVADRLPRQLIA